MCKIGIWKFHISNILFTTFNLTLANCLSAIIKDRYLLLQMWSRLFKIKERHPKLVRFLSPQGSIHVIIAKPFLFSVTAAKFSISSWNNVESFVNFVNSRSFSRKLITCRCFSYTILTQNFCCFYCYERDSLFDVVKVLWNFKMSWTNMVAFTFIFNRS